MSEETVMHDSKPFELAKALRSYQQADSDGILVMVSRQACVEGADWLERLERECEIRYHEYTTAITQKDRVTKILLGIYNLLHPQDVHADDGQIFRFVAPNPNELLHELAKRIRAIPVELDNEGLRMNKEPNQIAAKLYECRDTAKFLLGDGYDERMREYAEIVSAVSNAKGIGIIQAATEIAANPQASGYEKIQILASAVEIIEPRA